MEAEYDRARRDKMVWAAQQARQEMPAGGAVLATEMARTLPLTDALSNLAHECDEIENSVMRMCDRLRPAMLADTSSPAKESGLVPAPPSADLVEMVSAAVHRLRKARCDMDRMRDRLSF